MAREIVVGKDGKAEAVSYIDKATRRKTSSRPRVHGCRQRLRVSTPAAEFKSTLFPDGLANSSGVVGRYLTDSVGSSAGGYFPQLEKMPAHNHDGTGGMHLYMPWWKYDRKNDFLRGYHIEFGGGRDMPGVATSTDFATTTKVTARPSSSTARKRYGTYIGFGGRGEMIPNEKATATSTPIAVDQWGSNC